MHYSKLLLAVLPCWVAAAPVSTVTYVVTETYTVTLTANGQVLTQLATSTETEVIAFPTNAVVPQGANQPAPANPVYSAPAPSSPSPAASSPSASSAPAGSTGGSGCPIDPAAPMSPGMNGNPSESVHESLNAIRRLYNPKAKCLTWSPTLASASLECANAGTEGKLRANSHIVSDNGGYGKSDPWYTGPLATSYYKSSMLTLLCQSPDDSQLQVNGKSGCAGKVGEYDCTSGACTGHRDALVDAAGEFTSCGAGFDAGTSWATASFSSGD